MALIPSSMLLERGAVVVPWPRPATPGRGMHHLDVRAVLVELDPVSLADGVLDHEGEEPEVARGVPRDQVVPLEVEGREIAVVILQSLAHQEGAALRPEREAITRGLGLCAAAS